MSSGALKCSSWEAESSATPALSFRKRADLYPRKILIRGARPDQNIYYARIAATGDNMARVAWAVLLYDEEYRA
jgi:hypothetical protein